MGAPYALLSDNAKSELSNAVKEILRKYNIKDLQTEPHHPNQNPAERQIQEIKKTANTVMDRSGAPGCLWYLATVYAAYLLNRIAHARLGYKTPIEASIGENPDFLSLLHFHFYQPVLYYEKHESPFPTSKERLGWWVGLAENTGDALCYKILTTDNEVIHRSVWRPSDNPLHPNQREDQQERTDAVITSVTDDLDQARLNLPIFNPAEMVGQKFIKDVNQLPHKAKVIEQLGDGKYLIQIADGDREEIMTYNEIVDHINRQLDGNNEEDTFIFDQVIDHRKIKGKYEVLVKW